YADRPLPFNDDRPVLPNPFLLERHLSVEESNVDVLGDHLVEQVDEVVELLEGRTDQEGKLPGFFSFAEFLLKKACPSHAFAHPVDVVEFLREGLENGLPLPKIPHGIPVVVRVQPVLSAELSRLPNPLVLGAQIMKVSEIYRDRTIHLVVVPEAEALQ